MNILILTQYFWPESFRINDLAQALAERGHEVTVLTGMPNYPGGRLYEGYGLLRPAEERYGRVRVLRVPLLPRGPGRGWRLAINYLSFTLSASLLGPWRCRGPFDVLFATSDPRPSSSASRPFSATVRRVPLLFWVQDLWPESLRATGAVTSPALLGAVARVTRFIYRRCDRVLVQSLRFVEPVVDRGRAGAGALPAQLGGEPVRAARARARGEELSEVPHGFRVVFAGNIGAAQSFETILEAACLLGDLPDLHWVVVGDGHRRAWVEEQVRARGLERTVHLLGSRPVAAMPRYLGARRRAPRHPAPRPDLRADDSHQAAVLSRLRPGGDGGAGRRGSARGRGGGGGPHLPREDAEALAAGIRRLHAAGEEARRGFGRRGRAFFEANFERERLVTRTEELMGEAVREAACAS